MENTTHVSCSSPFYAAYLCLIILLAVGEMPEYLQNLDDGSVLLFRLCLENANIISEVKNIWSNEYFLNDYHNAESLEYLTKQPL